MPELIAELRAIVAKLERQFPGRRFTLDGHLVGSLGEIAAAHLYDLELLPGSSEKHDARARDGRLVQIKATQVRRVSLYSEPNHLLVLQLNSNGSFTEVYNGPGAPAWNAAGKAQKNGQRPVSTRVLRRVMDEIGPEHRLPDSRGAQAEEQANPALQPPPPSRRG